MSTRALKTSPAGARKLVKLKGPQPMGHQAVSLKHDEATPIVFDTSDPGTGKTPRARAWLRQAPSRRRRLRPRARAALAPQDRVGRPSSSSSPPT